MKTGITLNDFIRLGFWLLMLLFVLVSIGFAVNEGSEPPISEISFRGILISKKSGTYKQVGVEVREFSDKIMMRDFNLPFAQSKFPTETEGSYDRNTELSKQEYEDVWRLLLDDIDVWNLKNDVIETTQEVDWEFEFVIRRENQHAQYKVNGHGGLGLKSKPAFFKIFQLLTHAAIYQFELQGSEKRTGNLGEAS